MTDVEKWQSAAKEFLNWCDAMTPENDRYLMVTVLETIKFNQEARQRTLKGVEYSRLEFNEIIKRHGLSLEEEK